MTPERMSLVVRRWVRFYTRQLPDELGQRRVDEIAADLHDHITYERAAGTSDRRIALGILSRMARGMPADVSWRHWVQPSRGDLMKPFFALVAAALGIAAVALVLDSPLLVLVSVLLIGGVTFVTFATSARTALQRGFGVPFVAVLAGALFLAAMGVSAIVLGERGDAPGLVLLGIAVITSAIVGAFAFGVRTTQPST